MISLTVRKPDRWDDGRRVVHNDETGEFIAWISPRDNRGLAEILCIDERGKLLVVTLWNGESLDFVLRTKVIKHLEPENYMLVKITKE